MWNEVIAMAEKNIYKDILNKAKVCKKKEEKSFLVSLNSEVNEKRLTNEKQVKEILTEFFERVHKNRQGYWRVFFGELRRKHSFFENAYNTANRKDPNHGDTFLEEILKTSNSFNKDSILCYTNLWAIYDFLQIKKEENEKIEREKAAQEKKNEKEEGDRIKICENLLLIINALTQNKNNYENLKIYMNEMNCDNLNFNLEFKQLMERIMNCINIKIHEILNCEEKEEKYKNDFSIFIENLIDDLKKLYDQAKGESKLDELTQSIKGIKMKIPSFGKGDDADEVFIYDLNGD